MPTHNTSCILWLMKKYLKIKGRCSTVGKIFVMSSLLWNWIVILWMHFSSFGKPDFWSLHWLHCAITSSSKATRLQCRMEDRIVQDVSLIRLWTRHNEDLKIVETFSSGFLLQGQFNKFTIFEKKHSPQVFVEDEIEVSRGMRSLHEKMRALKL